MGACYIWGHVYTIIIKLLDNGFYNFIVLKKGGKPPHHAPSLWNQSKVSPSLIYKKKKKDTLCPVRRVTNHFGTIPTFFHLLSLKERERVKCLFWDSQTFFKDSIITPPHQKKKKQILMHQIGNQPKPSRYFNSNKWEKKVKNFEN